MEPLDNKMSVRYANGGVYIMFIKDAEAEVEMLNREGYVEVKELSDLGHNGFILTIEFFLW